MLRMCVSMGVIVCAVVILCFLPEAKRELPSPTALQEKFVSVGGITRSSTPRAVMKEVAYVILERTEERINITSSFFSDFGLSLLPSNHLISALYFRSYGSHHHSLEIRMGAGNKYLGMGVLVSREEDFVALANVGVKQRASMASGGGEIVVLTDPDGFLVEVRLSSSWTRSVPLPLSPPTISNSPRHRHRPVNSLHRSVPGPPQIEKLAHCATQVRNMITSLRWYVETLGMIVSDLQFLMGDSADDNIFGVPAVAFLRTQGVEGTPHHSVALISTVALGLDHCAFEVSDLDAIGNGQRWLQMRVAGGAPYTHAWGIGRHVLGSNLFDYWREGGADEMFEHTSDVDLLDSDAATGFGLMTPSAQHLFGPDLSSAFVRPLHLVKSAVTRLVFGSLRDGDLSLPRILGLLRAVSASMTFKEYDM